jgi:hypothetical protein
VTKHGTTMYHNKNIIMPADSKYMYNHLNE